MKVAAALGEDGDRGGDRNRPKLNRLLAGLRWLFEESVDIGRVAGAEVSVRYSWPVFPLVIFALSVGYLPQSFLDLGPVALAALAVVAALLLFASLLTHEIGHAAMARARGLRPSRITIFFLGGYTEVEGDIEEPRDEFLVFVAGPLSSLAVAGGFLAVSALPFANAPAFAFLPSLVMINVIIAGANLVPGLPLDGGRILRAAVRSHTGSPIAATYWASVLGQVFAAVLVLLAFAQVVGGSYVGAVWNVVLAWFLNSAASSSRHPLPEELTFDRPEATPSPRADKGASSR